MDMNDRQARYIHHIKKELHDRPCPLIIYGAGNVGRQLHELLRKYNLSVQCFCVTDVTMNINEVSGCPVVSVCDAAKIKDALFLLAALPPANEQMIDNLRQYGVDSYIDTPKDIRYIVDEVTWNPILEITSRIGCSVHCRYCPQDLLIKRYGKSHSTNVLALDTFKTCIDKTPQNLIVDFAGFAEPFLNPDIVSMMKYVAQSGRQMRLFTTLVGLTDGRLDEVLKLPFRYVVLHLPDCKHFANIPITQEYIHYLQRVLNARKPDGSPFIDKANGQADPAPEIFPYLKDITIYQNLIDWAGNISTKEVRSVSVVTGKIMCDYAVRQNHNVLLPDGTVVLCCMDWGMKHILGNLYTQTYEEIIKGEEKKYICNAMANGEDGHELLCRKCTNTIKI